MHGGTMPMCVGAMPMSVEYIGNYVEESAMFRGQVARGGRGMGNLVRASPKCVGKRKKPVCRGIRLAR